MEIEHTKCGAQPYLQPLRYKTRLDQRSYGTLDSERERRAEAALQPQCSGKTVAYGL